MYRSESKLEYKIILLSKIVPIFLLLTMLGGFISGASFFYRLSFLWVLLLSVNWIWTWVSLRGIFLTRSSRLVKAQFGQVFEERFILHNKSWIPRLWIEIQDQSELIGSDGSRVLTQIGGGQQRSYLARTRLTRRGLFNLGPTMLISGDPFGLFRTSRRINADHTLLVLPMLFPIASLPKPAGLLPGGDAIRRRTQHMTPNASGVREYAPGDPMKRIHWISTARRGRLISKEFELDPLADVWILMDAYQPVHASIQGEESLFQIEDIWRGIKVSLPQSTEEYAVSVTASIASYYIQSGRAVGYACMGQNFTVLPPDRGGRQLNKILEDLAMLKTIGSLSISGLMHFESMHMVRGSTVLIVTPDISRDTLKGVDHLKRRGVNPVVVFIDPSSFGGWGGEEESFQLFINSGIPARKVCFGDDISVCLAHENR